MFTVVGCSVPRQQTSISCEQPRHGDGGGFGFAEQQPQLDPGPYFYARFQLVVLPGHILLALALGKQGAGVAA